jgi:hypothetical protein
MYGRRKEGLLKMQEGIELIKANQVYFFYSLIYSLLAYCHA